MARRSTTKKGTRARKPAGITKKEQLIELFAADPDIHPKAAAKAVKSCEGMAYAARREFARRSANGNDPKPTNGHTGDVGAFVRDLCVIKKMGVPYVRQLLKAIETLT